MGIFTKKINPGAYRGELTCPVCRSTANRRLPDVTPTRLRFRCRKCGLAYQYDISNRPTHPYAPFKRNKFEALVLGSKTRR